MKTETRLRVERRKADEAGSCNFCNRQITEHGIDRHSSVTVVRGVDVQVRFCDVCLREFRARTQ
jgi:hypothetical protein